MKEKIKNNSGFTLVELIIAMAILAFLMTAVSAFMMSGVMSSRKAKADIVVHNTAQDVYDQLADSIMSAQDIIVCAYVIDGALSDPAAADKALVFGMGEKDVNEAVTGPVYFVRDKAQKTVLEAMPEYEGGEIRYYKDLNSGVKLYVKQLIIDKAVEIDMGYIGTPPVAGKYTNALTGEMVAIEEQKRDVEYDADGNPVVGADVAQSALGTTVYSEKDTERNIYSFDSKYMYFERKYAYMTELNDYAAGTDKSNYVFSKSFNYLKNGASGTVTGCVLTVDAKGGALGLDLFFSDKNMTYTTLGMINTRNSYVLKAKK